jgi:hypothetical protein
MITKLFQDTNIRIKHTMNDKLGKLIDTKRVTKSRSKFDMNGVYPLTYPKSFKEYIGQTDRPFRVRFREHYRDYKYANSKSKFAQNPLNEGHSVGSMNEIMDLLYIAKKGGMLDTWEKFYTFRETQLGNQINDKRTVQSNPIFEALIPNTTYRGQ